MKTDREQNSNSKLVIILSIAIISIILLVLELVLELVACDYQEAVKQLYMMHAYGHGPKLDSGILLMRGHPHTP